MVWLLDQMKWVHGHCRNLTLRFTNNFGITTKPYSKK